VVFKIGQGSAIGEADAPFGRVLDGAGEGCRALPWPAKAGSALAGLKDHGAMTLQPSARPPFVDGSMTDPGG